jgi:hypothetical protein
MLAAERLQRYVQFAARRLIDPRFARRPPGAVVNAIVHMLGPAVRMLEPSDRWNVSAFLEEWVKVLDEPIVEPRPKSKRIFMFTCYRGQLTHDFLLALLLAWRGHIVTLAYLPKLQYPSRTILEDSPSVKEYFGQVFGRLQKRAAGRVTCVDLSDWGGFHPQLDLEFLSSQLHADMVYSLLRETFRDHDPDVERARVYYGELGSRVQAAALAYLTRHRDVIDLCLIANGATFENAQVCRAAEIVGLAVNCYDKFAFTGVRVVNHGGEFPRFDDLDLIWQRRRELGLYDEPLRSEIFRTGWKLLEERRDSSGVSWSPHYQANKRAITAEEARNILGIEEQERVALVCPNVPFDAGYRGLLNRFPSMSSWLVETVRFLVACPQVRTVVRAHPFEEHPALGDEKIEVVLGRSGIDPNRYVLLPGRHPLNTYSLMPMCDFGVVFSSTTGVEMAMHGKPVLPGADYYYSRRGFTVDSSDRSDYFTKLRELVAGSHRPDSGSAHEATMLYAIFHLLLQWPYPFDKPRHLANNPPRKLVKNGEMNSYVETLDVMALTDLEWSEALPIYVNPAAMRRRLDRFN